MSTHTLALPLADGRIHPKVTANRSNALHLPSSAKRGLALLAAMSLAAGPAAAQATNAMSAPIDLGRLALALGVLSVIALIKVWAYADKRVKLMDRLSGYLTSRAAHRSRRASASAHAHGGATKGDSVASTVPAQAAVSGGVRPVNGFRVQPVPGLPRHLQYLTD